MSCALNSRTRSQTPLLAFWLLVVVSSTPNVSCNYARTAASSPIIIGGIGDSGTRGMRNLLELLGLRVCPATGKTGDDDEVQRATHRILYGSIFPDVEARYRMRSPTTANHTSPSSTSSSSSSASFTPDRSLLPGHLFPQAGDPYEVYTRALVSHEHFRMSPEAATRLCGAVARSFECATGGTAHGHDFGEGGYGSAAGPQASGISDSGAGKPRPKAGVSLSHMDPALKALLLPRHVNKDGGEVKGQELAHFSQQQERVAAAARTMPWGFKEPRSAMFLKEFDEILGGKTRTESSSRGSSSRESREDVSHSRGKHGSSRREQQLAFEDGGGGGRPKFLHVIRDGRDIAFGDLRLVTSLLCASYFNGYLSGNIDPAKPHIARQAARTPVGKACSSKGRNQLVAWALLNEAIADEALARFGSDRYLAVRIEDIALDPNPAPTIRRIVDFLGIFQSSNFSAHSTAATSPSSESLLDLQAAPPPLPVVVDEASLQAAVEAVASRIKGKHAGAYGGAKHGDRAARGEILVRLGLAVPKEEKEKNVPPNSPEVWTSPLMRKTPSQQQHEQENIVTRALSRFGYCLEDWGVRDAAWSAAQ